MLTVVCPGHALLNTDVVHHEAFAAYAEVIVAADKAGREAEAAPVPPGPDVVLSREVIRIPLTQEGFLSPKPHSL
jgi:hypothetical protein